MVATNTDTGTQRQLSEQHLEQRRLSGAAQRVILVSAICAAFARRSPLARPLGPPLMLMKIVSMRKSGAGAVYARTRTRCSLTERESHTAQAGDSGVVGS